MLRWIKKHWFPVLFFALIGGYFLYGLSPDVTWMSIGADMSSYVIAAKTWSSAGLSGCPLYIMIGSLLLKLPGNQFWLLGLESALPALGTSIMVFLIVKRLTTSKYAPYVASLVFATAFTVWAEAVIAETYMISAFAMSVVFYFCVRHKWGFMAIAQAFCLGLHPLTAFAIVPCTVYMFYIEHWDTKLFLQVTGITCIGLLFQLRNYFVTYPTTNNLYLDNPLNTILSGFGGYLGLAVIPIGPTLQRLGEDFQAFGSSLWTVPFIIGAVVYAVKSKNKIVWLFLGSFILEFIFFFTSVYPQWIKYMSIGILPMSVLVGIGVGRIHWGKLTYVLVVPCLIFATLNVATYSPGKTIDPQTTTARQFYNSLDSLPDNALVVLHTWGHPGDVLYEYCVDTHDRIDIIDWNAMVDTANNRVAYRQYQKARGIVYPTILDTVKVSNSFEPIVPTMTVSEFAVELQNLNPGREVFVTYVESSAVPMEFGLVPASQYSSGLNSIPSGKIQFSGG